jgi:phenylalanyl-tRNA synthetase beta chain
MKFSLKLAQVINRIYGTGTDPFTYGPNEIVQRIGAQLGAVEEVIRFGDKYDGVVVAKVMKCDKHPDADKLSLCFVDDGGVVDDVERNEHGYVQVVCGAANVREGISVAWIPPGATVPSTADKEPFVLEARELRGKISNGMLASPAELGISDDHDGILEIEAADIGEELMKPGTPFKQLYDLDDVVIDCENKMFTHRPDCFGNIGVAREISGIFGDTYTSPDWYKTSLVHDVTSDLPLVVKNDIMSAVPRFLVQSVADVVIKPAPMWLQVLLKRIDSNSINNIVDYTNYFMHETGQPLHAYDYDKVKALSNGDATIFPRMADDGEELALLNGKTVRLTSGDIVIATDKQAIGLAGVMGGSETEVDENTKNIIIECANFDMYTIRRTSMRHGLFTDAVTRFNKGQSPLQNDRVLAKMVDEVVRYADGKVASQPYDFHGFDLAVDNLNHVSTTVEFVNSRLGTNLTGENIKKLLESVEFKVEIDGESLHITAPFWRMDIAIGEDVVEEVGRLHGYHNVPIELPARTSRPASKDARREFKQAIRDKLVKAGANEVLTYSFVHGDLMTKTGSDPEKWALHLRNALSPDLQYYRTSLLPSLLQKVHSNLKADAGNDSNEFALFEIGKAHVKAHMEEAPEDNLPKQMRRVAFVIAADAKSAKKYDGSAFYQAKKYVDLLTNGQAKYVALDTNDYPLTAPYQKERSAVITLGPDNQFIGVIGEFRAKTTKGLKLPDYCAGFEIDTDLMAQNIVDQKYETLTTFPSSNQDVTFEVLGITKWAQLHDFIHAELAVAKAESGYNYHIQPLGTYQEDGSTKKRMSFRIELNHQQKTLKTDEVNKVLEQMTKAIDEKMNAKRI